MPTRCPNHPGRLCRTRIQPSRSGPEGFGQFPAEHGGHRQPIARPESRAGVGPEWHLVNAHTYELEPLTHRQWVFGCDVFCRVSQQDKGKRLGFSAVWRFPLQKRSIAPEKVGKRPPRYTANFIHPWTVVSCAALLSEASASGSRVSADPALTKAPPFGEMAPLWGVRCCRCGLLAGRVALRSRLEW